MSTRNRDRSRPPYEAKRFYPIEFTPFTHNVLDYLDRRGLVTAAGEPVSISRNRNGAFVVQIGNRPAYQTIFNQDASRYLNQNSVGVRE